MGKEILTKEQVRFLDIIQKSRELTDRVYLTGGTALAAFYLNHRESEDLDFFSENEIDPLAVETFLKSQKHTIGFETFEFQKSFNRNLYFLRFASGALKVEFTYFPFPLVLKGIQEGNLRIDSLRDIAVNKIFTISQQTRARDFIDLFFILKRESWSIDDLVKDARVKFDTSIDMIQLGSQFLSAREAKDMPYMRVLFDFETCIFFFERQAALLKKSVLS